MKEPIISIYSTINVRMTVETLVSGLQQKAGDGKGVQSCCHKGLNLCPSVKFFLKPMVQTGVLPPATKERIQ